MSHGSRALCNAAVCLLAAIGPARAAAIPLGRLFFTPQERATLDQADRGEPTAQTPSTSPGAPQPPRINGFVRRSDGALTTWVDGDARYQRDGGVALAPGAVQTPNRVVVRPAGAVRDAQHAPSR